jgi:hypothetical protein
MMSKVLTGEALRLYKTLKEVSYDKCVLFDTFRPALRCVDYRNGLAMFECSQRIDVYLTSGMQLRRLAHSNA